MTDELDQVLIGGQEKRAIVIVAYDPGWPERFERERDRIREALGAVAHDVEHIGSTSVPGLGAKPIIDVMVTVEDIDDEDSYRPRLQHAGYELRVREPGHRMFRTPERDVHVHLWQTGGEEAQRYLLFRDWLRHSADDRARYERVKRELARRDWPSMNHYADAKDEIVAEIMARANHWSQRRQ